MRFVDEKLKHSWKVTQIQTLTTFFSLPLFHEPCRLAEQDLATCPCKVGQLEMYTSLEHHLCCNYVDGKTNWHLHFHRPGSWHWLVYIEFISMQGLVKTGEMMITCICRSWTQFQLVSKLVDLTKVKWTPRERWTAEQSMQIKTP